SKTLPELAIRIARGFIASGISRLRLVAQAGPLGGGRRHGRRTVRTAPDERQGHQGLLSPTVLKSSPSSNFSVFGGSVRLQQSPVDGYRSNHSRFARRSTKLPFHIRGTSPPQVNLYVTLDDEGKTQGRAFPLSRLESRLRCPGAGCGDAEVG